MEKDKFFNITKEFQEIIKKELGGSFFPTSPKDYPPLETDIIDYEQQIDEKYFNQNNKCKNFEEAEAKRPEDFIIDIPEEPEKELELKYFLDGSFRTYYWGDVEIGNHSFPIILGETVISIVKRENKSFSTVKLSKKINMVLPPEEFEELQRLREMLQERISNRYPEVNISVLKKDVDLANNKGDLKTAMLGKIRAILHEEERKEIDEIQIEENKILVVDGDLRKEIFEGLNNTIGLAKSFSLKPVIITPTGNISLTKILRSLKKGQRTCVLVKEDEQQYKFWYIRLRNPEECETHWQGIVKVEVNLKDLKKPDKNFIKYVNQLSKLIYDERVPSSYPVKRWASHIYPIYVAEKLAKTSLTPPHSFRQLFKIRQ